MIFATLTQGMVYSVSVDFTKTAGGQPRPTQLERFRQRFMHKLVYYPANNGGTFGCVGCGRCLKSCPISMNIVKVIKALEEDNEIDRIC